MIWVYIAIGGAAGALARYTVASRVARRAGGVFPWGTLCVNTVGAFVLGLVLTAIEGTSRRPELAALLTAAAPPGVLPASLAARARELGADPGEEVEILGDLVAQGLLVAGLRQ